MNQQPQVGDIVLYWMPDTWQPGLGIRIYPAIVLYPNLGYGPGGIDVQVFCQPYEGPNGYHVSARRGEGPGEWRPKQPNIEQQAGALIAAEIDRLNRGPRRAER